VPHRLTKCGPASGTQNPVELSQGFVEIKMVEDAVADDDVEAGVGCKRRSKTGAVVT